MDDNIKPEIEGFKAIMGEIKTDLGCIRWMLAICIVLMLFT